MTLVVATNLRENEHIYYYKSISCGHEPEGKGEWEMERYELSGEPRDEDEELEREWTSMKVGIL